MNNNQKDLNKTPLRTTSTTNSPPNIKLERELKKKEILNSRVLNLKPTKLFEDETIDNSTQKDNTAEESASYLVLKPN